MLKLLKPLTAIGLELTSTEMKGAELSLRQQKPVIHQLFSRSLPLEEIDVKQLYMDDAQLITGLQGDDVLIRSLELPLTKEKDIEAALAFQAEPILPYPAENALLAKQILQKEADQTHLILLAARKDLFESHLQQWQQLKIEPEIVSCVQMALGLFGQTYIITENPFLILNVSEKSLTGVLVQKGKILASFTHQEGLKLLCQEGSFEQLKQINFGQDGAIPADFSNELKRLQQIAVKMQYALSKEANGQPIEGVLITGEIVELQQLNHWLAQKLNLPLLTCIETPDAPDSAKRLYAVCIGLALQALKGTKEQVNFRQGEHRYPYPWKRLKIPIAAYGACILLLAAVFYVFGQHYLIYQENQLKQDYVDLLAEMNKSHENFEAAFLAKNPQAREKTNGEIVNVIELDRQDLLERLQFLQKDLQATPDSFPLFANIPRVSDVLAWISQHPYVVSKNEQGELESRLQLENFSYTMLKRPVQGKKQEKYQVKVELEFSSPTPKWAREFHDALIASNDFVDPKGEVKWSSNRGKYRTSFFLKDKTSYPNQ